MANQDNKINKIKLPNEQEYVIDATYWSGYETSDVKSINGVSILEKGGGNITITLPSALKYCGITTTKLEDGSTVNPVIIDGNEHLASTGCVVFYEDKEFVFNANSKWELFGAENTYKVVQNPVSSPNVSGDATAFIDTISQDANGVITATKKNVKIPTPDWNAQEGEGGYIENRPFYGGNIIKQYGSSVNQTSNSYQLEQYNMWKVTNFVLLNDNTGESLYVDDIDLFEFTEQTYSISDGEYEVKVKVERDMLDATFSVDIIKNNNDCRYVLFLNKYANIQKLDDKYLPDTVIKTTPQTLSDDEKNQALTNLGLSDVVNVINDMPIVKGNVENSAVLKGGNNVAGNFATALGELTTASGYGSVTEGYGTEATESMAHAEGYYTDAKGKYSHAEGHESQALDLCSHAEGATTIAKRYAHSEGRSTQANGECSHSEGLSTIADGEYAHSEGRSTQANGKTSHSEGRDTKSVGESSHAEGNGSVANGKGSHAEGVGTITNSEGEHASGKYNISNSDTQFSIGIGTSKSVRKNAFEVKQNGDIYVEGVEGRIQDKLNEISQINKTIEDNEEVIASALCELNDRVDEVEKTIEDNEEVIATALCELNEKVGEIEKTQEKIFIFPEDFIEEEYNEPDEDGFFGKVKQKYVTDILENGYTKILSIEDDGISYVYELDYFDLHNDVLKLKLRIEHVQENDTGETINIIEINTNRDSVDFCKYKMQVFIYNFPFTYSGDTTPENNYGYKRLNFINSVITDGIDLPEENKQLFKKNMGSFADWNAQEGESGYIKNKTHYQDRIELLHIQTKHYSNINVSEYAYLEFFINGQYEVEIVVQDDYFEKLLDKYTNSYGSHPNFSGAIENGILYFDIDDWDDEDPIVQIIGLKYIKLSENYLPDTVIKTTPQTLSDTDKNQALDNLGIQIVKGDGENSAVLKGGNNIANGIGSISLGKGSTADGKYSFASGNSVASGDYSHSEGVPAVENGVTRYTKAIGRASHAEGEGCHASATGAHAEGMWTDAKKNGSHAEGYKTVAGGQYSHVEGNDSQSIGNISHAEGKNCIANGRASHAEGWYTIANNEGEHASGKYNVSNGDTQFSVGIGTSDNNRKNAFEVKKNGDIYIEGVEGKIQDKLNAVGQASIISVTYNEIVGLRRDSKLIPGQQYRITDYVTTTVQENTQSAGHQFDIIVTADDVNVLNENARAIQHTTNENDYFSNSDLSAWELKYCLDNDTDKFKWATESGKGVIYYMKDEWNNECPYDFKNIQFARWELSNPVGYRNDYDFDNWEENWVEESTPCDSLKTGFNGLNGSNKEFYYGYNEFDDFYKYRVVYEISESPTYCYTFGNSTDYSVNGSNYGNVIKEYKNGNTIPIRLNNIVFLSSSCYSNTFGNSCYSNTFGNSCYSNTFGDDCDSNTFGNYCRSNTFGNYCYSNTFGNYCRSNTFGNYCYSNTFGDSCDFNTFGNFYYSNTLGNSCHSNTFGNGIYNYNINNVTSNNTYFVGKVMAPDGFYQESDETLKSFVNDIEVDLDKIAELPKKYFYWIAREKDGLQMGTSAQAVKELYPELVQEGTDGKLTVDYSKLSIIALKAIDILNVERKQMRDDIDMIKKKLCL